MSYKFPAALASGLAALAVAAPVASAAITPAPLTIAAGGDTVAFTIAAPGESPTPDRLIGLFVAPAGTGAATLSAAIMQGAGAGAAQVLGSTADCQVINGADATTLTVPDPEYVEGTGFTWRIPASALPASFDAVAVIADDPETDTCRPGADLYGLKVSMAGAQRFPAAPVTPPVVVTPAPAPAPLATPKVTKPAADPDKDGIKNDWLANGKPVAAPKAPKVSGVTAHGATLKLPKAPKGGTLRVFVRQAGAAAFKAATVKMDKKSGKATISSLKAGRRYDVKLVAVNKSGQQTQASKAVSLKTKKK